MRSQAPSRTGHHHAKTAKVVLSALLLACVLAACTSAPKEEEPNIPPVEYKAKTLRELHTRLADPVGVRDASIAEPTLKTSGTTTRYIACVRYNSKDETGKYSGITERAVYFFHGDITQVIDEGSKELCRGAAYQPWPELTKMCKEIVCPGR